MSDKEQLIFQYFKDANVFYNSDNSATVGTSFFGFGLQLKRESTGLSNQVF